MRNFHDILNIITGLKKVQGNKREIPGKMGSGHGERLAINGLWEK
ncbi:hypothetical protein D1AOALGA4SA_8646 [Olavius algarvensis Delta 1 endosymbiont]|nr:hypothetical protein D1AOALGA4SA_8646 [Olavius algarvensis Delta 1 endosymbiont]